MIKSLKEDKRNFPVCEMDSDLVIAGGGLAGVCAAITAARQGLKVALVQDRSILGGNASSEVRLWVLGATSHMGNNNRWAREGGVVDEILVENTYKNPEGNPVIFDSILLDKVVSEKNITLLLNTVVYEVVKKNDYTIKSLVAFCSQNQNRYILNAPLFCDASGDGVVGFLAGAPFRMGAESKDEFDELFAPDESYGELLGHSLYFYSKDVGQPVKYTPPSFALHDVSKIPRFKSFNAKEYGCKLWWIEYGGRMDTVYDTENIKWELWKIVYGVWNYIKNSGNFPEAENLTLEWVGMISGKRESRRFEGHYILKQQDIVEQKNHYDAVAYGGWSIDLHPADGIYAQLPGCNQWHSKGIYSIPYRCLFSKDITNLFLAGRIISASHVAFGSTRVMATGAYVAQAVALAAAVCKQYQCLPVAVSHPEFIKILQTKLLASGQYIPHLLMPDYKNIARQAVITASSELQLKELTGDEFLQPLNISVAQMLPCRPGMLPVINLQVMAMAVTTLHVEVRIASTPGNFIPEVILETFLFDVEEGRNNIIIQPKVSLNTAQYIFVVFHKNDDVLLPRSSRRITGILSVFNSVNAAVSNYGKQVAPRETGMDSFEFWCPQRRPLGFNLAMQIQDPVALFAATNVVNGVARPTTQPNAWVANADDVQPTLFMKWENTVFIKRMVLSFDTDFDHPMESVLMTHPETVMPFCIRNYKILDDKKNVLYQGIDNYQTRNEIVFEKRINTQAISIVVEHPSTEVPAAIFDVQIYEE